MKREARMYLLMMACFSFAMGLSNLFFSVFIWKLDASFTRLAQYSLMYSLVVLLSFPLCARFARWSTPMASLRLGVICFIIQFGWILWFQERSIDHIYEIGFWTGMGASFFAIGMHMQSLDSTTDQGRDRFLYIGNFLSGIAGMAAPLLAGYFIERYAGMTGYYFIFSITLVWYFIVVLLSFQLKGKEVPKSSHLWEVWRRPSREWRGMYWVTIGSGMVEGTYSTFLVTLMSYSILKSEFSLGGISTFVAMVSLLSSVVLARFSRPERRLFIYSTGAILLALSSCLLAWNPGFSNLVIYAIASAVGMNLIGTTFNAWTYASIEKDPEAHARRLDYVVIREIPLGVGRMTGVVLFLLLQNYNPAQTLPISFAFFGSLFLCMIPLLRRIWYKSVPATSDSSC